MTKTKSLWLSGCMVVLFALTITSVLPAQDVPLAYLFFSTEEDFSPGLDSAAGNVISDGDLLLGPNQIYMRNAELLRPYRTEFDLGLDAVDVLEAGKKIVVFSTELAHPEKIFTAGDLLSTTGMVIPNAALLACFHIPRDLDLGLDAVQMVGKNEAIIDFVYKVQDIPRKEWLAQPFLLCEILKEFGIDIWFSTEGTPPLAHVPGFLDGDVLSALNGTIVLSNSDALPLTVPAGLPSRGVDFGLDAASALFCNKLVTPADSLENSNYANYIDYTKYTLFLFSTEILHEEKPAFTDGDILIKDHNVIYDNYALIKGFYPAADFLGLDAVSIELNTEIPLEEISPDQIAEIINRSLE